MTWKTRYYQLLDSLQRKQARQGREPRERRERPRQPRRFDPGEAHFPRDGMPRRSRQGTPRARVRRSRIPARTR